MHHRLTALVLVAGAVALVAPNSSAKDEKQPNYYPVGVGHTWEYELTVAGMNKTFITKFSKSEKDGDKELFLLEAEMDGMAVPITEHVSVSSEGVMRHKFNGMALETPLPLLKYPYKAKDTWTTKTKVGGEALEVKTTTGEIEEIETPAGKYKAAPVTLEAEQKVAGEEKPTKVITTYWFVADVGIVSQKMKIGEIEFSTKLKKFTPAKPEKK
jgi:hypothetical protein